MITPIPPQVHDRGKYTTCQVTALLGIHRNTLKAYADAAGVSKRKSRNCNRTVYLGSDIKKIWRYATDI